MNIKVDKINQSMLSLRQRWTNQNIKEAKRDTESIPFATLFEETLRLTPEQLKLNTENTKKELEQMLLEEINYDKKNL